MVKGLTKIIILKGVDVFCTWMFLHFTSDWRHFFIVIDLFDLLFCHKLLSSYIWVFSLKARQTDRWCLIPNCLWLRIPDVGHLGLCSLYSLSGCVILGNMWIGLIIDHTGLTCSHVNMELALFSHILLLVYKQQYTITEDLL